jgi:hypothetical protein
VARRRHVDEGVVDRVQDGDPREVDACETAVGLHWKQSAWLRPFVGAASCPGAFAAPLLFRHRDGLDLGEQPDVVDLLGCVENRDAILESLAVGLKRGVGRVRSPGAATIAIVFDAATASASSTSRPLPVLTMKRRLPPFSPSRTRRSRDGALRSSSSSGMNLATNSDQLFTARAWFTIALPSGASPMNTAVCVPTAWMGRGPASISWT